MVLFSGPSQKHGVPVQEAATTTSPRKTHGDVSSAITCADPQGEAVETEICLGFLFSFISCAAELPLPRCNVFLRCFRP